MKSHTSGTLSVSPPANAQVSMRTEARALLALGWVPSPDEPGRIYGVQADMPSVMTTTMAWSVLREVLAERGK